MSITRGRLGESGRIVGRKLAEGVRSTGCNSLGAVCAEAWPRPTWITVRCIRSWRFSARSGTSSACRESRQGFNDKNYSDSVLRQSKRRSTIGSSTAGGGLRNRGMLNRAHPERSVRRFLVCSPARPGLKSAVIQKERPSHAFVSFLPATAALSYCQLGPIRSRQQAGSRLQHKYHRPDDRSLCGLLPIRLWQLDQEF